MTALTEHLAFATNKRNRKVIEHLAVRDKLSVDEMIHYIVDEWVDEHLARGGRAYTARFTEKETT